MKITLLKELEMDGVRYPAGKEIEVSKEIYDWLTESYIAERRMEAKVKVPQIISSKGKAK